MTVLDAPQQSVIGTCIAQLWLGEAHLVLAEAADGDRGLEIAEAAGAGALLGNVFFGIGLGLKDPPVQGDAVGAGGVGRIGGIAIKAAIVLEGGRGALI